MPSDRFFMRLALDLAKRGLGRTSPNPMVGAIIVKDDKIVGRAFHKRAGGAHAEVLALKKAGDKAPGATLYVTLEPCNHLGKTPPCTEAIIKSGIKRVVAAMKDPNPLNNGKGFDRLRRAGIKVSGGVLKGQAIRLNEVFIKYIATKMPFVIVKAAQSLDGKIATRTGDSKWITGGESRRYVHRLRSQADAIMVGVGTVIKDDPLLTTRVKGRQPIKVIVDTNLKTSVDAKIFSKGSPAKVIIATAKKASKAKIEKFAGRASEVLVLKDKDGKVNLRHLMKELGRREVASILVEGGGELIGGLVEERLVDKFLFFVAPKIIGGKNAITSVEGRGIEKISQALSLKNIQYKNFGEDLLIESYPLRHGIQNVHGHN